MFHINFFLSGTFRMIIFSTLWIITFYTSTRFNFFTYSTLMFKSSFINILNSFNIDCTIFLFKITFRYPYCTDIMYPYIMTWWLVCRIGSLIEIIIIKLIFLLSALLWINLILLYILLFLCLYLLILLFLFIIWTLFSIFEICRIKLFKHRIINMYISSFKSPTFHITHWTWYINSTWSKGQTDITYPTLSWYFS